MNNFINKLFAVLLDNIRYLFLLLIFFILFNFNLDYYIYSPGGLEDLTDRIEVDNSYKSKGSFNLTYVTARNGNIPNLLLSYIIPSWDRVKLDERRVNNESREEILDRDKIYLKETSYDAIIAAFKEAGLDYKVKDLDVVVTYVLDEADTNIEVGDSIKSINGVNINTFDDLVNEKSKFKKGDKLNVIVERDNKEVECYTILYEEEDNVMIGVMLAELKNVETNPKVKYIFKDNESGSSRGLMCALDIYNKITEYDLTKGRKISGTGSIDENGIVGSISGIKYKLIGAVKNKADIFIVPEENYEEAIKIKEEKKYKIEIIKADTLHNVIEKLK